MISKFCVPVAINGHMQQWIALTDGAEGQFIKQNTHPSGGNCFVLATPGGMKLAGAGGPDGATAVLTSGLDRWRQMRKAERSALPAGKPFLPGEVARCVPPLGALILHGYTRNVKLDGGKLDRINKTDLLNAGEYPEWRRIYTEPAHHTVWLTEAEWRSLVPAKPTPGQVVNVPSGIQRRLFRFHLNNGCFGLAPGWALEHVRAGSLTLTVEKTQPALEMRLEGSAVLATDADLTKADHGYDVQLLGKLVYDHAKGRFTRFDCVALGDYWGGDWEGGRFQRPGRTPLGIAFELATGNTAVDLVPPHVHMDRKAAYDAYFAADRP